MNTKTAFAVVAAALFTFTRLAAGYACYESPINLERSCNGTVTISCPTQYSGRAGTVRFWNIPQTDCKVNVTLEQDCGYTRDTYAIYFNIRKFNLPYTDEVTIYEDGSLIKSTTGSLTASYDPTSVAQVRTRYSRRPAVRFEYERGSAISTASHEAFFDYIVVEGHSTYRNTYCSALSGYVNDDYICEKDGSTDRCNCPSNYSPNTYGRNPAYSRQYCRGSGGYGYNSYLSAGAITGISVTVFLVLVALISLIASASRRSRVSTPRVMTSTGGTITVSRPVVVGQYESVRPFSAAPPSYAQVTGPGGAATYPALPAQKF